MKKLTNKNSSFRRRMMACLTIFGGLFFGSLVSASAQSLVTFAQFVGRGGSGQNYTFTNNTTNGTFNTVSGGAPVRFFYDNISGLDPSLQDTQNARLFLTTSTTAPATLSGNTLIQTINNSVNTIQIIRDTPAPVGNGSRTNLLTVTFSPVGAVAPSLTGADGGNSASFSATTPDHTITFTSDFLNFSASTQRNLALSFSSLLPSLSIGSGGFLNNFIAAGSGTFASNPPPTTVSTVPTAATVTVGGRVLTPSGRGLRNAQVTVTQADGSTRTVLTGVYGAYSFADLAAGQTVVLSVRSKSYQFATQIVTPGADLSGIDFVPDSK